LAKGVSVNHKRQRDEMANIKTMLWSAIGGAIVWWIVMSTGFGWTSAGSGEQQAVERARAAMLDVLTPICVERFNQDAENKVKFKALQETSSWNQADYVAKQGWATMAGSQVSENQLAKACASQILTAKRS
jgi:hypothetical protein